MVKATIEVRAVVEVARNMMGRDQITIRTVTIEEENNSIGIIMKTVSQIIEVDRDRAEVAIDHMEEEEVITLVINTILI